MEENVIQINGGLTKNVDVNAKNVMYVKKNMFGILLHVVVKNRKYFASIVDDSVIIESYDEKADTNAEAKPNDPVKLNNEAKSILAERDL